MHQDSVPRLKVLIIVDAMEASSYLVSSYQRPPSAVPPSTSYVLKKLAQ